MTTLKKLAEYWVDAIASDPIYPEGRMLSASTANQLGKDVLSLIERLETLEEKYGSKRTD